MVPLLMSGPLPAALLWAHKMLSLNGKSPMTLEQRSSLELRVGWKWLHFLVALTQTWWLLHTGFSETNCVIETCCNFSHIAAFDFHRLETSFSLCVEKIDLFFIIYFFPKEFLLHLHASRKTGSKWGTLEGWVMSISYLMSR